MAEQLGHDSDLGLAREAAAGSHEAFDALVGRHQTRIVNLLLSLTGGSPDAEDLAQDVFIRAFRGIDRFRGESAFRTWLFNIAINVARSHRSRLARLRRFWGSPDDGVTPEREPAAPATDAEADLVRRNIIDSALRTLPSDLRVAVVLRDLHGFEYREIATMTGVPIGTVESRIFRARQRLRPLLAPLAPHAKDRGTSKGYVPVEGRAETKEVGNEM